MPVDFVGCGLRSDAHNLKGEIEVGVDIGIGIGIVYTQLQFLTTIEAKN